MHLHKKRANTKYSAYSLCKQSLDLTMNTRLHNFHANVKSAHFFI